MQSSLVEEEYSVARNALPRTEAAAIEEELGARYIVELEDWATTGGARICYKETVEVLDAEKETPIFVSCSIGSLL